MPRNQRRKAKKKHRKKAVSKEVSKVLDPLDELKVDDLKVSKIGCDQCRMCVRQVSAALSDYHLRKQSHWSKKHHLALLREFCKRGADHKLALIISDYIMSAACIWVILDDDDEVDCRPMRVKSSSAVSKRRSAAAMSACSDWLDLGTEEEWAEAMEGIEGIEGLPIPGYPGLPMDESMYSSKKSRASLSSSSSSSSLSGPAPSSAISSRRALTSSGFGSQRTKQRRDDSLYSDISYENNGDDDDDDMDDMPELLAADPSDIVANDPAMPELLPEWLRAPDYKPSPDYDSSGHPSEYMISLKQLTLSKFISNAVRMDTSTQGRRTVHLSLSNMFNPFVMSRIVDYLSYHNGKIPKNPPMPVIRLRGSVSDFDVDFVESLSSKQRLHLILAANYLDISSLIFLISAKFALDLREQGTLDPSNPTGPRLSHDQRSRLFYGGRLPPPPVKK